MTTRRDFLKGMGVAAGAAILGAPAIAKAQQVHRWRVQTLWAAADVPQKLFQEKGGMPMLRQAYAKYNAYTIGTTWWGVESLSMKRPIRNADAWKALPDEVKSTVEKTWREFSAEQVKRIAADDLKAVNELKQKGIEIIAWSKDELNKARALATTVWDDWAKKSPLAKQAVDSQKAFLKELKLIA